MLYSLYYFRMVTYVFREPVFLETNKRATGRLGKCVLYYVELEVKTKVFRFPPVARVQHARADEG